MQLFPWSRYVVDGPLPRRAMRLLDCDRALALNEAGLGYVTRLGRLEPLTCSPKHDVLLGWRGAGDEGGDGSSGVLVAEGAGGSERRADESESLVDGLPWLA